MIRKLLEDYEEIVKKIKAQKEDIQRYNDDLVKITQIITDSPKCGGGVKDKNAELIARRDEEGERLISNIAKKHELVKEIRKEIEPLCDDYQEVITLKNFENWTFGKIADRFEWSVAYTRDRYKKSLDECERLCKSV